MTDDTSAQPTPSGDFPTLEQRRVDVRAVALVLLICAGIYLPVMGKYGMYDPWETHYTEVGRQFMERGDWMSTYWRNGVGPEGTAETNFWSKPVGSFWMSGLSLKMLGYQDKITLRGTGRPITDDPEANVGSGPDPGEVITTTEVEWAVRLPFFLCGLFGIWCIFLMCSRLFGRRVGILSAVILATAPIYFMITRQAMTDMPYVGPMSGGIALLILALFGKEDDELPRKKLGKISWPHWWGYYAFIAAFILVMTLQMIAIIPELTKIPLVGKRGPAFLQKMSAATGMSIYGAMSLWFLWLSLKTKKRRDVYIYTFYMCTAIAGLSKGLIGALQPGFMILLYLIISREWRLLAQMGIGRGLLIAIACFAPWWHGMVARYGMGFWNSLVGTEQIRRLTIGEQKQAIGTWEYYVKQLGYGLFPWFAFLPAALVKAFQIGNAKERSADDRARLFIYTWFAGSLALFSITLTKYHHYILPAVPPAAICVALFLDDLVAGRAGRGKIAALIGLSLTIIVGLDLIVQPAHWVWMFTYLYTSNWARGVPQGPYIMLYVIMCASMVILLGSVKLRRFVLWGLCGIAVLFGGFTLNWYQVGCAPNWSQKYVLKQYYKLRKGPHEQLIGWQFNWRGETWHTAAQVVVSKSLDNTKLKAWLNKRHGRKFFFITERGRYNGLKSMLPTKKGRDTLKIVSNDNVHYVLASAEL